MSWDARNGILGDELFLTCIEFILASWLSFYTTYVAKLKIHLSEIVEKTTGTLYELLYYIDEHKSEIQFRKHHLQYF